MLGATCHLAWGLAGNVVDKQRGIVGQEQLAGGNNMERKPVRNNKLTETDKWRGRNAEEKKGGSCILGRVGMP